MNLFQHARRCLVGAAGVALLAGLVAGGAAAQDRYPSQPIRIVVPYPAGGTTDLIGRQFAEQLGKELGQTVIVENRPGGSTNIGAESVARAKPDGYTLLMANNGQVLNPVFGPTPSFELSALEPISLMSRVAFVLAANPKVPFNTGAELLSAAKVAPGKLTVSSAQLDLYVELLNRKAGITLLHVPYKGGAAATTDAISGQVNMVFALVPVLQPHIQGGKLKALAVTTAKRSAALPDVPTVAEAGFAGYDIPIWTALMAPKGTPAPVLAKLRAAVGEILQDRENVQKMHKLGLEPGDTDGAALSKRISSDIARWRRVAKAANIQPQ